MRTYSAAACFVVAALLAVSVLAQDVRPALSRSEWINLNPATRLSAARSRIRRRPTNRGYA